MVAPDGRDFATWLAAADDRALARLLAERKVAPTAGWTDFFDAADALQDPVVLVRSLATLTRGEAEALAAAVEDGTPIPPDSRESLGRHGLIAPDGLPYGGVAAAWMPIPPASESPETVTAGIEDAAAETDDATAERAFTASTSLADILQLVLTMPLARIGSGALGAVDRRRLVDSGAVTDGTTADELLAIAERTGLVQAEGKRWLATELGLDWLHTGTVHRWNRVAEALRASLPSALKTESGGWIAPATWRSEYPLDASWPDEAERLRRLFRRWALIGNDGEPPSWADGLSRGAHADESRLQAMLPHEVDRVFLQNDLTAIAPGPLEPHLDMRLRSMAHRESRAQASTYRFSAETIDAAVTAGETAESLREFLSALSMTGLPQPLAYEIDRATVRHGRIRVGADPTGRTVITSDDDALLDTIAVDQALRPLGIVPDGETLATRINAETTFWALADARYPVVAVDGAGSPRVLQRHRLAAPATLEADPEQVYAPLLERLHSAHDDDADGAWLMRELDQAVRARAYVTVVVRLPDASERTFTLEATGLGGGRLRGRDRAADVERTLPVSHIVSVRPADS